MEHAATALGSTGPSTTGPPVPGALAQDDASAFEQIMRSHNQRLYRLALGLVGDPGEAEDVLQDSYVRAFLKLSSFAGDSSLGAWLASIVRHQAIDHLRARRARRAAITLEADLPQADGQPRFALESAPATTAHASPELGREREEARAQLENAIALLPASFRAVFVLREIEGMTVRETALYLDIPAATVKTRDHRARLLLRAALGADFAENVRHAFEFLNERCDRIVARVLSKLIRL